MQHNLNNSVVSPRLIIIYLVSTILLQQESSLASDKRNYGIIHVRIVSRPCQILARFVSTICIIQPYKYRMNLISVVIVACYEWACRTQVIA